MLDHWHLSFVSFVINNKFWSLFVGEPLIIVEKMVIWVCKLETIFFGWGTLNQSSCHLYLVTDVRVVRFLTQMRVFGWKVLCTHRTGPWKNLIHIAFNRRVSSSYMTSHRLSNRTSTWATKWRIVWFWTSQVLSSIRLRGSHWHIFKSDFPHRSSFWCAS